MIELVPASPAHVGTIARRMRPADVAECSAMGFTAKGALRHSLMASSEVWTAKVDGIPQAMFGLVITNALCGAARPWMLGSEAIYQHPRAMMRGGKWFLHHWLDSTPSLSNLVSAGNNRAIRMLRRWGCKIGSEVIVFAGLEFVTFTMER